MRQQEEEKNLNFQKKGQCCPVKKLQSWFCPHPNPLPEGEGAFYPLALWERVAEGRVRDAGVTLLYGNRAMQKSNRTTLKKGPKINPFCFLLLRRRECNGIREFVGSCFQDGKRVLEARTPAGFFRGKKLFRKKIVNHHCRFPRSLTCLGDFEPSCYRIYYAGSPSQDKGRDLIRALFRILGD